MIPDLVWIHEIGRANKIMVCYGSVQLGSFVWFNLTTPILDLHGATSEHLDYNSIIH